MKSSAMVVLSGGQDSATCLLEAVAEYDRVHAVSFDYGQRHRIELRQARKIADLAGAISYTTVDVRSLLRSRSPLVDLTRSVETYKDFESMEAAIGNRIEDTFVPLRNPFFLLLAANLALSRDCYTLVTGVCQSDTANYPDCTQRFVDGAEYMMREALGMHRLDYTGPLLSIRAPLMHLTKADTVKIALRHGELGRLVLAASHTCYNGSRPPCGVCHSCTLRAEGFRQAGDDDPLLNEGLVAYVDSLSLPPPSWASWEHQGVQDPAP